jgi:nickel-dependent lactate racemase
VQYYAERNELPLTKIHVHNCHDDQFQFAGNTARGNAVYFNRLAAAADIFITVSDFKNHYFAGYSNPVKCFLPGICKYETVERNHALALKDEARFGHHPLHADPSRRNNPLAADMVQGCNLITNGSPVYVVALLTSRDKIIWCETGLLEKVTPIAFHEVDKRMSIEMPVADRLIVSCGGAPNDESLYTSQRALELSKNAVRPGGEVLFMAACANGIGPQKSVTNFYEPLRESPEKILTHLNEKYVMYAHKTYKFARMIQQLRGIHMHSKLSEEQVRAIHLVPAPQPQSVVDSWLKENPDCTINVVLDGNKFAIHAKQ